MLAVLWYLLVILAVFFSYQARTTRAMYWAIMGMVLWSAAALAAPNLDFMGYDADGAAVVNTYTGAWYMMILCFGFALFDMAEIYTIFLSPGGATDEPVVRDGMHFR